VTRAQASKAISAATPAEGKPMWIMIANNIVWFESAWRWNIFTRGLATFLNLFFNFCCMDLCTRGRLVCVFDLFFCMFGIRKDMRSLKGTINTIGVNNYGADGTYYTAQSSFFYEYSSTKPVLITEYGFDAFQVEKHISGIDCAKVNGNPNEKDSQCLMMQENQTSQAIFVAKLTEEIERNAVTCLRGCDSKTGEPCHRFAPSLPAAL